jgi:hypothetical protein
MADLNAAYPNGTFFQAFKTVNNGTKTPTFTLTGDAYPAATPQISDYSALQNFNAGADFTLTWAPLGGGTNDFVHVEINNTLTNLTLWETPEEGEPGALNGTSTSVVIPAGTLNAGANYLLYLTYEKPTLNLTAYPGATGITANYKQTVCPFRAIDVFGYGLLKSQVYLQINDGPPSLQQYEFSAFVDVDPATTNLIHAVLQPPGVSQTFECNAANGFQVDVIYSNKGLMDAQFVPGTYLLTNYTVNQGVQVASGILSADNYPTTAPQIANLRAALAMNCGADFTLSWLPLNSSTNPFVFVSVDEAVSGETVFSSPWIGTAGALNGTATSVLIPAGTLRAGYSYLVTVMHANVTLETSSYPGAVGLTGYDKQTQFTLTVPGTPFPKIIRIVGLDNGQVNLLASGEPERTNILEAAASLAPAVWTPLTTNQGTYHFSDTPQRSTRYYRLREATTLGP